MRKGRLGSGYIEKVEMALIRPRLNDHYGLAFTQEEVDFAIPFLDDEPSSRRGAGWVDGSECRGFGTRTGAGDSGGTVASARRHFRCHSRGRSRTEPCEHPADVELPASGKSAFAREAADIHDGAQAGFTGGLHSD